MKKLRGFCLVVCLSAVLAAPAFGDDGWAVTDNPPPPDPAPTPTSSFTPSPSDSDVDLAVWGLVARFIVNGLT